MSTAKKKSKALGHGMDSLIPSKPIEAPIEPPRGHASREGEGVHYVPIEEIMPMPGQPRASFNPTDLKELADSIKEKGVLQPVLVRRTEGGFQLIAGERRWRASQSAGLTLIPVLIKNVSEAEAFELALIENIQREDLNPVDVARAFQKLIETYALTQSEAAERVGKDRSSVANYMRILKLPEFILRKVEDGTLSFGHARTLAGLERGILGQIDTDKLVAGQISVRELERQVARIKAGGGAASPRPDADLRRGESAQVTFVRRQLERLLGLRVELKDRDGKGQLRLYYSNLDELQGLLELLGLKES